MRHNFQGYFILGPNGDCRPEWVTVFVKSDNKILGKVLTDDKGDFKLTFTPENQKSFNFYCTGVSLDTLLICSMTIFESDTAEHTNTDIYFPGDDFHPINFYLPNQSYFYCFVVQIPGQILHTRSEAWLFIKSDSNIAV